MIQVIHLVILALMRFYSYPEFYIYPYLVKLGWQPYSQIIDQHFPGIFLIPLSTPLLWQIGLLLIIFFQSFFIYKITKSKWAIAFFAVWQPFFAGNHLWIDTLLPLFTLPAFYFFSNPIVSGLFLGIALLFKQSIIILILILLFFSPKKIKFLISSLLPISIFTIYFAGRGVLPDFFFWTVQFNFQIYPYLARLWPATSELLKLSLPAILFLVVFIKSNNRLLKIFATISLIGLLPRFNFTHFQPAIPFFAILLSQLKVKKIILAFSLIWSGFFWLRQFDPGQYPFFDPQTLTLASKIDELTPNSEPILILGAQPHLYVLSHTIPAGNVFSFSMPWYLPQIEDRLLQAKYRLAVIDHASSVDGRPLSSYAPRLLNYIQSGYQPIYQIGTVKIYENRL